MGAQTKQELELNGQREDYLEIKDRPEKDRVTQLVIIGVHIDQKTISNRLDQALV